MYPSVTFRRNDLVPLVFVPLKLRLTDPDEPVVLDHTLSLIVKLDVVAVDTSVMRPHDDTLQFVSRTAAEDTVIDPAAARVMSVCATSNCV